MNKTVLQGYYILLSHFNKNLCFLSRNKLVRRAKFAELMRR